MPNFRYAAFAGLLLAVHACIPSSLLAQTPPKKGYDALFYSADLTLDRATTSISGHATMRAHSTELIDSVLQHLMFLTIDSVFVQGNRASFSQPDTAGEYRIAVPGGVMPGIDFEVVTYYHGIGKPETQSPNWGGVLNQGGMMFAMGVGFRAPYVSCTRHWLPCYDLPDDKADSVRLTFHCAATDIVASVGTEVSNTVKDGVRTSVWEESKQIATYLMTFAVAPYFKIEIPNENDIPFHVYALLNDTAKSAQHMRGLGVKALHFFDSLFAPYPFQKVGYVVAPIGSMEHQTMVTLDRRTLDSTNTTASHELAHQWFGDWVTCYDFNDPWLNEGFATFCESLVAERYFGIAEYRKKQKANIRGAVAGDRTVAMYGAPYALNHTNNYPSAIIYQKGAAVLGMLRDYLGDSKFFNAIRYYANKHGYSTATSFDLWHDVEASTGEDLGWFFSKWVFTPCHPKLRVSFEPASGGVRLRMEQTQDSIAYGFWKMPVTIALLQGGVEKSRVRTWLDSAHVTTVFLNASFPVDSIVFDPDGVLLKEIEPLARLGVATTPLIDRSVRIDVDSNPVSGRTLRFRVVDPEVKASHFELQDIAGKVVANCPAGAQGNLSFDVRRLPAGAYMIVGREATGGVVAVAKVTIVRR